MPYDVTKTLDVYDIKVTTTDTGNDPEFHTLYSQGNDYVVQGLQLTETNGSNNIIVNSQYDNIYNETFRYGAELVYNAANPQKVLVVGGITVGM